MSAQIPRILFWIAAFAAGPALASPPTCPLTPLDIRAKNPISGTGSIDLGEADNPNQPTSWQGPLKSGKCSFDIGIIEGPIVRAGKDRLFVPIYSGSETQLLLLDLSSCHVAWKSNLFAGDIVLNEATLSFDGQLLRVDTHCAPVFLMATKPKKFPSSGK